MQMCESIEKIKGIGDKTAAYFKKMHILSIEDLLHHYPTSYDSYSNFVQINSLKEGMVAAISGRLSSGISTKKVRSLVISNVQVSDATGDIYFTFFHMPYLKNVIKPGVDYVFRGLVQKRGNRFFMEQPAIYKCEEYALLLKSLQPRYALTKGLTNKTVTKAIKSALSEFPDILEEDAIFADIVARRGLVSFREAMEGIHFPKNETALRNAHKRLAYEEFYRFLLQIRLVREENTVSVNPYRMFETADTVRLLEQLPYSLTKAQKKVWAEIRDDLSSTHTMNRLIQGDVGSGKTILAILSLLMAVANGYQAAFMAPTDVLATQHYETIVKMTKAFQLAFKPVFLTGSVSSSVKKKLYEQIASGEVNLVIGTHALIQEKVNYKNLALVITDEQHRFGVRQREALVEKGCSPHILVMSATPIPRTLAIILYGDLSLSVIDEKPANRLPIKNCVVGIKDREKSYRFIENEVKNGRQAYIICPMVEEGEAEGLENVTDYARKLKEVCFKDLQVAVLHGRMKPAEKNSIMASFADGHIDVLVSTTVIEVGIDVSNATVIMIENAERFGLAQLHQLRGRVGRGEHQSYCIFLSTTDDDKTKKRLEVLNHSNDGFYIAGEDLKMRGPGDLFGIRQSGLLAFQIADIYQDAELLKAASEDVENTSLLTLKDTKSTIL